MKWLQAADAHGTIRLGFLDGAQARILRAPHQGIATTLDLLQAIDESSLDVEQWLASATQANLFDTVEWSDLSAGAHARQNESRNERKNGNGTYRLRYPLTPPEVWGCGVTYRRSADFREEGSGIYDRVYVAPRPELFFKATASRCVGHGEPIGKRSDSQFTAAEPEVALAIGARGRVLGYALCNDVSAWDIERDNPLYLPQSKVYLACFAFGPCLVTPDEIRDPSALVLTCRVTRNGQELFRGSASTGDLRRPLSELVDCLRHSNVVPTGTMLATGTGIIQPLTAGLEPGDIVTIACPELGELRNTVAIV
jgi:2-dehydro-3-deoxy-D-arabinonate dehydratase